MADKKVKIHRLKENRNWCLVSEKQGSRSIRVSEKELDTLIVNIIQKYLKAWQKLAKL
jgi:hypothetical protein